MLCGGCKHPFSRVVFLFIHWAQTHCSRTRDVWERVMIARRNGTSGRRILHEAFPDVYKSEPMPEELKQYWKDKREEKDHERAD